MSTELELTARILAITTRIREQHPELAPYMAVSPVLTQDEENSDVNLIKLQHHYDKLNSMLRKYAVEFPQN